MTIFVDLAFFVDVWSLFFQGIYRFLVADLDRGSDHPARSFGSEFVGKLGQLVRIKGHREKVAYVFSIDSAARL